MQEFPEVRKKRQIFDHYLKDICKIKSYYGILTIEITLPNPNQKKYHVQTDDIDIEFSKVFTEYKKYIQHQNSQKTNSIFTNSVFSVFYSYLSIKKLKEPQGDSTVYTSRHTTVRQEMNIFSKLLNAIREIFTNNDVSQNVKRDLKKNLAWFIIDYFSHNIDLISLARKKFDQTREYR